MKKLLASVIAAAIALCALVSCSGDPNIPDGFKLASNDICDFDLVVPQSWTVSLSDGTVAAYCSPTDPSSISVMPGELEYADTTVSDWWESYKTDFETVYSELTVISETDASLDGASGKCYTFTGKLGENTYRFEITAVIMHSRLYMMTFTSTPDLCSAHEETLSTVKDYFKFH